MKNKSANARPLTDREEAEIQRQIAADPDDSEATDEQLAQAKPFREALPELYASIQRARGRPKADAPKEAVTLRLDPQTLQRFKATGKDWRTRMAEVLERAKI
ncbi:BrnA antitoxin family protein [Phyllobacterium pellucidum]|uniref:BrnA antitoxin family protein n=1 Tax=Phyllobacterium pellucidum TaxID=2740464 RepID=UPI001D15DE8F|nr:BrnA antitoxin family protein [Phyllobacterium sp. T1018]UGY10878.1 BrnA antitoxin family protein [Phyllobacterium sp. T1018]